MRTLLNLHYINYLYTCIVFVIPEDNKTWCTRAQASTLSRALSQDFNRVGKRSLGTEVSQWSLGGEPQWRSEGETGLTCFENRPNAKILTLLRLSLYIQHFQVGSSAPLPTAPMDVVRRPKCRNSRALFDHQIQVGLHVHPSKSVVGPGTR